jgi:hypothetical protein
MNKTTILPDGSAFSTAVVMSKEEAMALPLKDRPICYRISGEMYMKVWESVAEATGCWKSKLDSKDFDAAKAEKVAMELMFAIADEVEKYRKE